MDFNQAAVKLTLALALYLPSVVFFYKGREKEAFWWLLLGALALRLVMISLDPYLHEWDERYHALVAKNMMEHPFKPMLRVDPVLDYDFKSWCCNHIWVHKQPLFMWQMALSMKLFGVSTLALRLPNVIMGVLSVFFIYDLAKIWTRQRALAYAAAFLFSLSCFQLEMTSGRESLEHNDLTFTFYVTASLWALGRYLQAPRWRYALLIGLFAGAAILNKWLTGFLVFGGWGLAMLLDPALRRNRLIYRQFAASLLVTVVVFLPWQLYTLSAFPQETAATYELNRRHIFEILDDHVGGWLYHLDFFPSAYSRALVPFLLIGLAVMLQPGKYPKIYSLPMVAMLVVVYAFFSWVKTKMPAFTFPVSAVVFILAAAGLVTTVRFIARWTGEQVAQILLPVALIILGLTVLKPSKIVDYRSDSNEWRNAKIHNTLIFKKLGQLVPPDYLVLNCKSLEDTELMFWQPHNAYHWFPPEPVLRELQQKGLKIAAFKTHTTQHLPDYILRDSSIKIIDQQFR